MQYSCSIAGGLVNRLVAALAHSQESVTAMERRMNQRFQIRLPMTVRWTSGSSVGEILTESKNVSSRGVYFFLPKEVKETARRVEILLTLPHEITLAGPVRVRCLGRVSRNEVKTRTRSAWLPKSNATSSCAAATNTPRKASLPISCGCGQETPGRLDPSATRPG